MPTVFMRKGQMVNGVFVPAGMAVYGLTGAEAALAAQGGDGLVLPDPDAPSVSGAGNISYNADLSVASVTTSEGTTTIGYDLSGRPTTITAPTGVRTITYNANGTVAGVA